MRNRFILALAVPFFFAMGIRGLVAVTPGPTPDVNPEGNTGALKTRIETGGGYDVHSGNASRSVTDLQVPGALGVYGLDFTRHWNSVPVDTDEPEAVWPLDFGYSGWAHSWGWNAIRSGHSEGGDDGEPEIYVTTMTITFGDGHTNVYKITRSNFPVGPPPANPHYGPPYSATEADWPVPGEGVHDYLGKMAPDGSEFWLYLADGGSVHFIGGDEAYRASEVFDPHGFKTELIPDEFGRLHEVRQEGGRSLFITWRYFADDLATPVITQVDTGGSSISQRVTYRYQKIGTSYVLANVTYRDDPAPGQTTTAYYTYSGCYGGDCSNLPPNVAPPGFPILTVADDPRFAGPMTKILYAYRGYNSGCHRWSPNPPLEFYAGAKRDYFRPEPEAILMESSGETGAPVSSFQIGCFNGTRTERNGINGTRKFYFGRSSGDLTVPRIKGYQLAKVTDFTTGSPEAPSVPFVHQNYNAGHPWKVWDGKGHPTELVYTGGGDSGLPGQIRHLVDGSVEHYNRIDSSLSDARDETRIPNPHNQWLFWKQDELTETTVYRRDARRRVKQIDYPDNSHEFFIYDNGQADGLNQITSHTLPSGAIETYVYDPTTHLLMQEYNSVDGQAARKEYTYDSLGRVETMTDGRARAGGALFTVRMTYNGRHQVLSAEYAAPAPPYPTVRYEYDRYGNCTAMTDELGHRKTYTYDTYRRCTSYTEELNAPGWDGGANVASRRWDWIYDRYIDTPLGTFHYGASSHTSRDWRVQVEPVFRVEPVSNSGDRRLSGRKFDCNNRIIEEVTGMIEFANGNWNVGPDTEVHSFTYDQNGQKSSYTDPRGRLTTYDYDNRNRLWKTNETVNTIPRTTETHYDVAGNKTLVKFPDQQTQQWPYYDAFGQPRQFIDEHGKVTDLDYWGWGPMKKLARVTTHRTTDGNESEPQPTDFYYDLMGRPHNTYFPDNTHEYTGYEFGQVKVWETRRRQTKTVSYDVRGREYSHSWGSGAAPGVKRLWDDANRLTRIWNAYSNIEYSYDDAGQMRTEKTTVAGSGTPREVRYCRYPSGDVSRVTYPDGSTVVNREYTARGQLKKATWGGGSVEYTYFRDGKVDYEDYGNGVRSDLDYNERGFINLTNTYLQSPVRTYAKRDYWRDQRDRIIGWKKGSDPSANPKENGRGDLYDYDLKGQLRTASYQVLDPIVGGAGAERADSFQYDELGNRKQWNTVASRGAMWFERRDNKLNQYESWNNNYPEPPLHWGSGIFHDDNWSPWWVPPGNGVTIADGWITASYNALNQPVAMGNIGYGSNYMWFWYDPVGRCVKRWMGTGNGTPVGSNPITYFYYDGWNLIQERSTATVPDRVYVHGNRMDEIVASAAGGNWLYHHYDARGHCILQTNASGGLQEQYDYDAFGWPYFYTAGGVSVPQSPSGNRFLFTGREFLSDLRIYDYRNRMYQPELGRFLQPDPKEFEAGDYNLYRYCNNDPVNKSDPFGLAFTGADTVKVEETGDLFDDRGQAMFGRTTYGLVATVSTDKDANGRFFTYVSKYNVTVLRREIATTANGETRTPQAIEATRKSHEPLHDTRTRAYHDRMQKKVLESGLKQRPTQESVDKAVKKLGNQFDSFNKREQEDCKKGQGVWKLIKEKEAGK